MGISRWLAERKLKAIEARLSELDMLIASRASASGARSYELQELTHEQSQLRGLRLDCQKRLSELSREPTSADRVNEERRRKFLDAYEAEQRANKLAFIAKLEKQGNYRQAKIHRLDLLDLRERLEAQFT